MSKNIYMPHPIDTKEVVLPKELEALAETLQRMCMRYGRLDG